MFSQWVKALLKKWWWVLGILPFLTDYITHFIPSKFLPTWLENYLENGPTWQVALILFCLGFLVSAFLVYRDTIIEQRVVFNRLESKVALYENHKPSYQISIQQVETKTCRSGCHIEPLVCIRLEPLNEWAGYLTNLFIENTKSEYRISGLDTWEIDQVNIRGRILSTINEPYEIYAPHTELNILLKSEIIETERLHPEEWETVEIPLKLVIGYLTQPDGQVEFSEEVRISIDLSELYPKAMEYQTRARNN